MKIKAILKRVNEEAKFIEITADTTSDIHEITNVLHLGHATIGFNLCAYFDDEGYYNHIEKNLPYNCDIPSHGDYANHIWGDMIVTKYTDSGDDMDCTDLDLQYFNSIIFQNDIPKGN